MGKLYVCLGYALEPLWLERKGNSFGAEYVESRWKDFARIDGGTDEKTRTRHDEEVAVNCFLDNLAERERARESSSSPTSTLRHGRRRVAIIEKLIGDALIGIGTRTTGDQLNFLVKIKRRSSQRWSKGNPFRRVTRRLTRVGVKIARR